MTLQDVIDRHRSAAISTWHRDGFVSSKLWAEGPAALILAEPAHHAALKIEEDAKAMMLWLMATVVNANVIGRVDEAWLRERSPDMESVPPDYLSTHLDSDPSIKTGLVVSGLGVAGGELEGAVSVAMLDLTDDGQPVWTVTEAGPELGTVEHLIETARLLAMPSSARTAISVDLLDCAMEVGWTILLIPQTGQN